MHLDYDEIVKDFDIGGLTLRKVTNKFVTEHFANEISDLRLVMTMGNGDLVDNNEELHTFGSSEQTQKIEKNEVHVNLMDLLMGQEMSTSAWLGFVQGILKGDYVRTVRGEQGIFLINYDKENVPSEAELFSVKINDIPEKNIVLGIKKALKDKIKSKN